MRIAQSRSLDGLNFDTDPERLGRILGYFAAVPETRGAADESEPVDGGRAGEAAAAPSTKATDKTEPEGAVPDGRAVRSGYNTAYRG